MILDNNASSFAKEESFSPNRTLSVIKKTISILKTDNESIELLENLLSKCNDFNYGRQVTISDISLFAIRKLKPEDIKLIKESTLTVEEKTEMALSEFNKRNGTSFTLIEMAMRQLKKEKKESTYKN